MLNVFLMTMPALYSSVLTVKDNFLRTRVQSEEIFQTDPDAKSKTRFSAKSPGANGLK